MLKGIPQEGASRYLDELQRMTADENFCAMLHNEAASLHSGEVNDFAFYPINGTRVGSQMVKGNDSPVE